MKKIISPGKENRGFKENLTRILVLVLILTGWLALMNQRPWAGASIPRYQGTYGYEENTWVFRQGNTVLDPELELPAYRHLETGKTYSVSTVLTYNGNQDPDPACVYFVDHMFTRALVDGKELFRYMPGDVLKPDFSRSPGNVYASFRLPRDCMGRELVIEFIPALSENVEYGLPILSLGDFAAIEANLFMDELFHNIIVVISAFLGILTVLASVIILPKPQCREGVFIGIFAILFSLYNLTESDFDFYLISNPYYTYVLDYTTFTLIPLFLIAFLRERMNQKFRPVLSLMVWSGGAMFLTEMILHFSGLVDMREFLPVLHIVYATDMVVILALLTITKNNKRKIRLILQLVPILGGVVLDLAVYYLHWQLATSDSTFTAIGVVIFLVAELYQGWKYSLEIYTESIRSREYREMAFIDALTGVGNRRAFEMERENLSAGKKKVRSMILVSADLNNLKIANDTFGHAAGDFLIRSAAEVLAELSDQYGHTYRIGGDEFFVFLYDMDRNVFQERLKYMAERIAAINDNSATKLDLAVGYEFSSGDDLDEAIVRADKQMYRNKNGTKAEEK